MQTPYNLQRLRELRRRGQSPELPVLVTDQHEWMAQFGALGIRVRQSDSAENWDAIAGLEVILDLPDSLAWTPLMKAVRDAKPRRLQVLAEDGLTTLWYAR